MLYQKLIQYFQTFGQRRRLRALKLDYARNGKTFIKMNLLNQILYLRHKSVG